ncbi:amino acid ABC transporter permease [Labrys wisconsinensis]|uniref:Polar amino acid transport system permease protein n=1 Tax=Labrys wisconsinensis TaxID=425677 RepID=A0ABU0JI66_9HYPH|nr:amino acid ABC transporter permease [Labrys wisconsinensis]MDQ0473295.1 polar amino acid transport system permease protein [Labrys wisconsinensis]
MFDWTILVANQHLLWWGLLTTLKYTLVTSIAGLAIGLLVALAQLSRLRVLRYPGRVFVEFFRNIPLLVWLLWSYYALPIFAGINITKEMAGVVALSLYVASYYAEILRAGIQSIDRGQTDASRALGMSDLQAMRRIILPQAVRRMIPPLSGQTIIQMKNTTLLSVITIPDLLYQAGYISSFTYRPMEVYTAVGVVFLVILVPLTWLARRIETMGAQG